MARIMFIYIQRNDIILFTAFRQEKTLLFSNFGVNNGHADGVTVSGDALYVFPCLK